MATGAQRDVCPDVEKNDWRVKHNSGQNRNKNVDIYSNYRDTPCWKSKKRQNTTTQKEIFIKI